MFRSVLSVVLGFLVMALTTFAYIALLVVAFPDSFSVADESGVAPPPSLAIQLVTLFLDFATAVFGGFFTAAIAGTNPRKHALALAILIGTLGLINTISAFGSEPVVYAWVRTILAPFLVYGGGVLREKFTKPATGLEGAFSDD